MTIYICQYYEDSGLWFSIAETEVEIKSIKENPKLVHADTIIAHYTDNLLELYAWLHENEKLPNNKEKMFFWEFGGEIERLYANAVVSLDGENVAYEAFDGFLIWAPATGHWVLGNPRRGWVTCKIPYAGKYKQTVNRWYGETEDFCRAICEAYLIIRQSDKREFAVPCEKLKIIPQR